MCQSSWRSLSSSPRPTTSPTGGCHTLLEQAVSRLQDAHGACGRKSAASVGHVDVRLGPNADTAPSIWRRPRRARRPGSAKTASALAPLGESGTTRRMYRSPGRVCPLRRSASERASGSVRGTSERGRSPARRVAVCAGPTVTTGRRAVMPAKLDLAGQRFGKLVAIEDAGEASTNGSRLWRCRCDCGREVLVQGGQLKFGRRSSCGCARLGNRVDVAGQRFGKLVAIADADGPAKYLSRPWRCLCDCGREVVVPVSWLRRGAQTSCGCSNRWKPRGSIGLNQCETDDEILQAEILFDLEKEFGPAFYPTPRGPVFHQSLTSDYELECAGFLRPSLSPASSSFLREARRRAAGG